VESLQLLTKRLERDIRDGRESMHSDLSTMDGRHQQQLQTQNQQLQHQLQSLRLEMSAEIRRQQYGNDTSGIVPFLVQLVLPFLSRDSVASLVQWIREFQGPFLQKYIKSMWLLVVFGDIGARWLEHRHSILYNALLPNVHLSAERSFKLRALRVIVEIVVSFQLMLTLVTAVRSRYCGAKQKLNDAKQSVAK
jgi:hypothetical protein